MGVWAVGDVRADGGLLKGCKNEDGRLKWLCSDRECDSDVLVGGGEKKRSGMGRRGDGSMSVVLRCSGEARGDGRAEWMENEPAWLVVLDAVGVIVMDG